MPRRSSNEGDKTRIAEGWPCLSKAKLFYLTHMHDRMPVIVPLDKYELWLDPDVTEFGAIRDILKPYDATAMRLYPVNRKLNSNNDDAESASPVILDTPTQAKLF
jgi:putative SOS response-associated peptidase YedK